MTATAATVRLPLARTQRRVDLDVLARSALFAELSPQDLAGAVEQMDDVALAADATLELDAAVCIVLEGRVRVGERELASGAHAGVAAALGGRSVEQLVARTDARVALLPRARLDTLATTHPARYARLLRVLAVSLADRAAGAATPADAAPDPTGAPEITVRGGGRMTAAKAGTRARAFLPDGSDAVAVAIDGRPAALDYPLLCDVSLEAIAADSVEGRVIARRTLGLVMLVSAARTLPAGQIAWRTLPSGESLLSVEAGSIADPALTAASLEREANAAIERGATATEEVWSIDRARHHFRAVGWDDAAALLRMSREPTLTVLRHDSVIAPRFGPAISDVGKLRPVSVRPHPNGFLILDESEAKKTTAFPDAVLKTRFEGSAPGAPADAHGHWLQHLGITSVGALNDTCIAGSLKDVIRISEGFHEKRVSQIADMAHERRDSIRCIRMAGPSASGKSTFIERLKVQLEVAGIHPVLLSLDDYYRDRDQTPRDEAGEIDFEALDALDRPRLSADVAALLAGRKVRTSRYDFLTGKALPTGGPELSVGPGDMLLLEGLHALAPDLLELPESEAPAFSIFVHPATTLPFDRLNHVAAEDVRLLRRIVRDRYRRGYSAADNILRWPSVRRGEHNRIFPSARYADAVFDSSLIYEISVLKVYAERYLLEVPEDHPAFPTALRLRGLCEPFVAIYPNHVPPNSILREFIGR